MPHLEFSRCGILLKSYGIYTVNCAYLCNPYSQKEVAMSVFHDKKNQKSITLRSEFFSYVKIFTIAAVIAYISTHYIVVNAQVTSGSMKNTIMINDRLVGFRFSYLFDEPKRGDIVTFEFPDNEEKMFVKRIIGISGDIVQIKTDMFLSMGKSFQKTIYWSQ